MMLTPMPLEMFLYLNRIYEDNCSGFSSMQLGGVMAQENSLEHSVKLSKYEYMPFSAVAFDNCSYKIVI